MCRVPNLGAFDIGVKSDKVLLRLVGGIFSLPQESPWFRCMRDPSPPDLRIANLIASCRVSKAKAPIEFGCA